MKNTPLPQFSQLNTLGWNTLLSLNKLYCHSFSSPFSYSVLSFNSTNKALTLFFDSNISESRVSDIDDKDSVCVDKVVCKLCHYLLPQFIPIQFNTQFIQIQSTQSDTQ